MLNRILYIFTIILVFIVGYLSYDYYSYNKERELRIQNKGEETTGELRDQVDKILVKIIEEGSQLAELLGNNQYEADEIERMIKESSLRIPEIQGVTACFEPYAFSKDQKLYCPYYNKGTKDYLFVGKSYDYSVVGEGTAWYTDVREQGAKWVEPYFAKGAQDWYIDYGLPFYYSSGPEKGKVRGTITLSFVCSGFKKLVHSLSIGKTGYGLITSKKGTLLSHPINEYIGTTSINELKNQEEHLKLRQAYEGIEEGQKGQVNFYDPVAKDNSLFFYDHIPSSGWGIGLLFYENDLLGDYQLMNRKFIRFAIWLSLLFVCILAIYFNKDYLDEGEIWQLSIVASLLLLGNICLIGYLQHNAFYGHSEEESPPITDMTSLSSFVNQQNNRSDELKLPHSISIPTGIYVQRMEFEDSYNLNIGGTVWQKYPLEIIDEVQIGFTFPQMSPFSEAAYLEESYRKIIPAKEGTKEYLLVGWDFRVTLRLNLDYSDYPFDKRHVNIEIVPLNQNDHLIFTPDLASYHYTNPAKKSGLDKKIEISGSEILESYFNYSIETYESDFGYGNKSLFEEVPILHYNIYLRRILLNAFITYLIPIFVTLIIVFIMIHACGKTQERQGIIESMAAFFFVLIFSHIDLRKEIVTADLIYMEYFYFIAYFILIFATFNLVIYTKDKSHIFDYNENQIFKALFFPLFLFALLIVTLFSFY